MGRTRRRTDLAPRATSPRSAQTGRGELGPCLTSSLGADSSERGYWSSGHSTRPSVRCRKKSSGAMRSPAPRARSRCRLQSRPGGCFCRRCTTSSADGATASTGSGFGTPCLRQAFDHLRDVAGAWFLVAAGASLIAVAETWGLREVYQWGEWSFWALLAAMLLLGALVIVARIRRPDPS
jgi:hypothetical protein